MSAPNYEAKCTCGNGYDPECCNSHGAPDLASWCSKQTCGRDDCDHGYCAQFRAAAAALRAGAEREATLRANFEYYICDPDRLHNLRRKVAKYIRRARDWRLSAKAWSRAHGGASAERDEALAALREAVHSVGGGAVYHSPEPVYAPHIYVSTVKRWSALLAKHGRG